MKRMLHWFSKLATGKKVLIGLLLVMFGLPLLLVGFMFIMVLLPFIGFFAAVILLLIALFKRSKRKQYSIMSIASLALAISSFFMVDAFLSSQPTNDGSVVMTGDDQPEVEPDIIEETKDLGDSLYGNETINQLVTTLNTKYDLGLTKDDIEKGAYASKASFQLNGLTILLSDTDDNLFVNFEIESPDHNDEIIIETFRQLVSALSPGFTPSQFNEILYQLKTYNYQNYDKLTHNNCEFTLNTQKLIDGGTRYSLKSTFDKSSLFTDNTIDYKIELPEQQNETVTVPEKENESVKVTEKENESVTVPQQQITDTTVHFIDTGHSDAILIENNGQYALIDAGDRDDDATVKSYLKNQGVTQLEYFIITHFHADHFGASDTVVSDFEVKTTLVPNGSADTQVYRDFINALSNKGLSASVPLENSVLPLGNATLTFFNTKGRYTNPNNNSLVTLLQSGTKKALFTGDAESEVENTLTTIGDVDLFKVAHHGSKTSNSQTLLNRITPEYAVIMVGTKNKYAHPDAEVMERYQALGTKIYRTDEQGNIVFTLSESGISADKSPGTYTPGAQKETTPEPAPTPTPTPTPEPTPQKESYQNCTELRKVYPNGVASDHPAYESRHDRDKDNWACEK